MACNLDSIRLRMAVILMLAATCLLATTLPAVGGKASITYSRTIVAGVPVHVVTIDMTDLNVRVFPMIARDGVGHSEPWSSMIGRARPTAAITGTFFDTRSLHPTGDIVIDGSLACYGTLGTAVCIGWNNEVSFVQVRRGSKRDWSSYHHVLVAGPMLVSGGRPWVNPRAQGFRDGGLFVPRPRTAIGVTRYNTLVLVVATRPIYLRQLAHVMCSLGAVQAAALDGGSSCGLYYRGRTIVQPGRRMTNLLVAYE